MAPSAQRAAVSPEVVRMRLLLQKIAPDSMVGSEVKRQSAEAVSDGTPIYVIRDDTCASSDARVLLHLKNCIDSPEELATVRISKWTAKKLGALPRHFLSKADFDAFLEDATAEALRERISSSQARRERSAAQMALRLKEDGFDANHIESAVQRAVACGLIDDLRYGEAFVSSKVRLGWGRARIERELERAGVDAFLVPGYPERFFAPSLEEERARSLLAKKQVPAKSPVEKLARFLISRGFEHSLSLRLARERVKEHDGLESV